MADGWGPPVETQDQPQSGGWGPPVEKPEEQAVDKPMPGFFESLSQGLGAGITAAGQTGAALSSSAPVPDIPETSPAAQPYEWRDIAEPSRLLAKTAYGVAKSAPTIAAGVAGGAAGSAIGSAVPVIGTTAGGLGGGALGAAAGSMLQTIGPVFAQELKQTPDDPEGAWSKALNHAMISGAASGASWALFPAKFLNGPLKNLAFQVLGVQPAVGVAEQGVQNIVAGKPVTENMGQAYAQSAVGTAVPAIGHAILTSPGGERGVTPLEQRTPAQQNILASAQAKAQQAETLETQARAPGVTTNDSYNQLLQAGMLRQEAKHETFLANIPPQPPDVGLVKGALFRNFLPELTSEKALQTAPRFGEYAAKRAQDYDSIMARADDIRRKWDWVPFDDVKRWFDVYETKGATLPPDLIAKYPFMQKDMVTLKKWLNQAYFDETDVGSKAAFIMEYFPHLFKKPDQVQKLFSNLTTPGSAGATWFQKARYYDLITQALNNGLELKTKNPVDLVTHRLMSGADMRARMSLLDDLHSNGVAVPVTEAPAPLLNTMRMPSPWKQVDAPNGTRWMLAPDVQALWDNAVVSKGLWADPGIVGRTFQGWMGLKAAWVPIKLGASLFHPIHVLHINLSNNISRALNETFSPGDQGALRRMVALPEAVAQSVMDTALAFPIGTPHLGKEVRAAHQTVASQQTPRQKYLMDLYQKAGASPQLAEQLRSQGKRAMEQALVNVLGPDRSPGERALSTAYLPVQAVKRLAGLVSVPFFEHWIPNLKAAALIREAEMLARRRPDIMNDPAKRSVALNAFGKQVDNRFGEMFYNSLFWNRTMKDAAIGSFLSLGWNLGFFREFVGGALEPAARRMMDAPTPTRALIREVTSKSTNLLVYSMSAMTLNAAINNYFTGEMPKEFMDYIFPRIGGTNTDGTPRRISNPFYTREVPMAAKNIEDQGGNVAWGLGQMLFHKLMFAPVQEAMQNRDYFGGQIYDQNAPAYKQITQFVKHMFTDQLSPMSVTGAQRALELSGKPKDLPNLFKWITGQEPFSPGGLFKATASGDRDVVMPALGFGPAPSYASRSSLENRINSLGRQFVFPAEKPFQENQQFQQRLEAMTAYKQALQRHDRDETIAAAKKMAELGMTTPQIRATKAEPSSPKVFQRLPESQQVYLLRGMNKEEFKIYYPHASKKTKSDPAVLPLVREYYRQ